MHVGTAADDVARKGVNDTITGLLTIVQAADIR